MYASRSYICSCILLRLLFIKFHDFSRSSSPKETVSCANIHACVVMLIYGLNSCYFWKYTLIYWARFGILFHFHNFHHKIINNPSQLMNSMFLAIIEHDQSIEVWQACIYVFILWVFRSTMWYPICDHTFYYFTI